MTKQPFMWMSAAILTICGIMTLLTSCINDDNPVEPSKPKRVSRMSDYTKFGDDYVLQHARIFSYDTQGRIVEYNYVEINEDGTESPVEKTTFTYAADHINTINTLYPSTPDEDAIAIDVDYELDSNGRIVKGTDYTYSASGSEQDVANPSIVTFEYDEQGHLVTKRYSTQILGEEYHTYEWKDGELWKYSLIAGGTIRTVITYEPSDVPVRFPLKPRDLYEWLQIQGFFGQWSHFMPAKVKTELSVGNITYNVTEQTFTYEMVDGLVTAYYENIHILSPMYNYDEYSDHKTVIEWE